MISISSLFNAYIDINILLIVAFTLWLAARKALHLTGQKHAYTTQLRLLYTVFLAIAVSPVFVFIFTQFLNRGVIAPIAAVNLSDFILAQYLHGSFEMKPTAFEAFLGLRESLTSKLVRLDTWAGLLVTGFIFAGIAAFAFRLLLSIKRLNRIIEDSHVWRRFGNLHLLVSDTISIPFSTRTLRNRYVVIPSDMLANSADLKIALGHEFQHMRQFDIEWEIALEVLKPAFFWNPVYYIWKRQVEKLRELSCDQNVLARKPIELEAYCACLLRVCHNSISQRRLFSIELPKVALAQEHDPLFGQKSAILLRQRLLSLVDGRPEQRPQFTFALLMVPLLAVVVLTSIAIQKPTGWSHDRLMLSTIVNLERLADRNSFALQNPTAFQTGLAAFQPASD